MKALLSREPRFLRVAIEPLPRGECTLSAGVARYVTRVHRLGQGGRFVAFDPEARLEAEVEIIDVGRTVRCRVGLARPASMIARSRVTLLYALGKGDKPDQVIRDATALGVESVVLVESARTVVRLDAGRADARQKRLRTIAVESARQCGRGDIPRIDGPIPLEDALGQNASESRFCLSPSAPQGLATALAGRPKTASTALLVGPEGGFSEQEEALAANHAFAPATLGEFVLRTETAAIAALAVVAALTAEE